MAAVMGNWASDLRPVDVVQTDVPKPLTLVYPYYCNPIFLQAQLQGWDSYPPMIRPHVSVMLVDDGSPQPAVLPDSLPVPIRLFRIEQDIRWNWLAARNIGMHYAADGWCLLTDMDHVVPISTLRHVIYGQLDPSVIYVFSRIEHNGEVIGPHSASFLMTRELFWRIGGYDERLSGHYGTDGDWRRRCLEFSSFELLTDRLIRYEYVADSSTVRYLRKQPEDAAVKKIVAQRKKGWRPQTLSFPFHEVRLCH